MKVQEVNMGGHRKRYLLAEDDGRPIMPVAKYLKHMDNIGKSPNTQRTYCYALKQYYEFLRARCLTLEAVGLTELSDSVGWLRFPSYHDNVSYFSAPQAATM